MHKTSKLVSLSLLSVGAVALAVAVFLPQPVDAAAPCWSSYTGWRCVPSSMPPPPDMLCAVRYQNGQQQGGPQWVPEGECDWTCS